MRLSKLLIFSSPVFEQALRRQFPHPRIYIFNATQDMAASPSAQLEEQIVSLGKEFFSTAKKMEGAA